MRGADVTPREVSGTLAGSEGGEDRRVEGDVQIRKLTNSAPGGSRRHAGTTRAAARPTRTHRARGRRREGV
eukprot:7943921-Alexandrium_andersonii.AAC.1